ncbi:MAG: Crp/Fnr family transcriptional regulator [Galbibacter orientalis]|uniref:Crp/Fnr family transcriptional regulator n=1 Tax=Galbibacter orientalis TaxID=453852 RepID=UPI0030018BF2
MKVLQEFSPVEVLKMLLYPKVMGILQELNVKNDMKSELKRHIQEIITLTDSEFELIAGYFVSKHFKKGQFVIQQGEKVPYTYFVVNGLMKLICTDESGKEHILSFVQEDWWESDYFAFYNKTSATMALQCLENSNALCITLENLNKLCTAFPKMEHFFLQKANSGHIASQQRILSLLSSSAQERYFQLMNRYPLLLQRVSKTQLAAYLGVSRETLSRLYLP